MKTAKLRTTAAVQNEYTSHVPRTVVIPLAYDGGMMYTCKRTVRSNEDIMAVKGSSTATWA